jgi:hypothetical protein
MALVGGIAAALVVATLPHVYLESIIGATGLSEIVSAAAPPLGNTARGLIAVVAGLVSASAIYIFLNRKSNSQMGGSDMSLAIRRNLTPEPEVEKVESKSSFTLPKISLSTKSLTKFLKKPKKVSGEVTDLADLPNLRQADSHPDAPARAPIFAAADLGSPLAEQIKPFEAPLQPIVEPEPSAAPAPQAAAPVVAHTPNEAERDMRVEVKPEEALDLSKNIFADRAPAVAPVSQPVAKAPQAPLAPSKQVPSASAEDMADLSIAQLATRLETGLARLKELEINHRNHSQAARQFPETADKPLPTAEDVPVIVPPLRSVESPETTAVTDVDAQAARQADMDAALKAALGTLERMTAHR